VGENLHQTIRLQHRTGATVRAEGELADVVLDARLLQLFLGLTDGSDLGARVDDARNDVVVHMASLTGDDLGNGNAFFLSLVREHRAGNHVADGVDARHVSAQMSVDLHAAALINLDTGFLKTQTCRVGLAARGHQNNVCFDGFAITALCRLEADGSAVLAALNGRDLRAELEGEALLGEQALELLGDLAVHAAEDIVEVFDNRHFSAEACPDRTELEANDTAANDDEL